MVTIDIEYSTNHPPDPEYWTDGVAMFICIMAVCFLLAMMIATWAFYLAGSIDIRLKSIWAQSFMYVGAILHIIVTMFSYVKLEFLEKIATENCILFDYWLTMTATCLWTVGLSLSISHNVFNSLKLMKDTINANVVLVSPSAKRAMDSGKCPSNITNLVVEVRPNDHHQQQQHEEGIAMQHLGDGIGGGGDLNGNRKNTDESMMNGIHHQHDNSRHTSDFLKQEPGEEFFIDVNDETQLKAEGFSHNTDVSIYGAKTGIWSNIKKTVSLSDCSFFILTRWWKNPQTSIGRIIFLTLIVNFGFIFVSVLLCVVAQLENASVATSEDKMCISLVIFKVSMAVAFVAFTAMLWAQLFFLQLMRMVPEFCSGFYRRMLILLTILLLITIVLSILGVSHYWWGRFVYVCFVVAIYLICFMSMIGSTLLDFIMHRKITDKRIMGQLSNYKFPKTFTEAMESPDVRPFVFNDFNTFMNRQANPVLVPREMAFGKPGSMNKETWISLGNRLRETTHEAASSLGDSTEYIVVYPELLIELFKDIVFKHQSENNAIGHYQPGSVITTTDVGFAEMGHNIQKNNSVVVDHDADEITEVLKMSDDPESENQRFLSRLAQNSVGFLTIEEEERNLKLRSMMYNNNCFEYIGNIDNNEDDQGSGSGSGSRTSFSINRDEIDSTMELDGVLELCDGEIVSGYTESRKDRKVWIFCFFIDYYAWLKFMTCQISCGTVDLMNMFCSSCRKEILYSLSNNNNKADTPCCCGFGKRKQKLKISDGALQLEVDESGIIDDNDYDIDADVADLTRGGPEKSNPSKKQQEKKSSYKLQLEQQAIARTDRIINRHLKPKTYIEKKNVTSIPIDQHWLAECSKKEKKAQRDLFNDMQKYIIYLFEYWYYVQFLKQEETLRKFATVETIGSKMQEQSTILSVMGGGTFVIDDVIYGDEDPLPLE